MKFTFENDSAEEEYRYLQTLFVDGFYDPISALKRFKKLKRQQNYMFDINKSSSEADGGNTMLLAACYNKNTELANLIIKDPKTNINKTNVDGYTPLMLALKMGLEHVSISLMKSVNIYIDQKTFICAIFGGCIRGLKTLVNIHQISRDWPNAPLENVAIDKGDNQDSEFCKVTPFHAAVMSRNTEMIDYILSSPNFQMSQTVYTTPRIYSESIVMFNPLVTGYTFLQWALELLTSKEKHPTERIHTYPPEFGNWVFRRLLNHKDADINAKNSAGNTLLHIATQCRDAQKLEILLRDQRLDISIKNLNDSTAFWHMLMNPFVCRDENVQMFIRVRHGELNLDEVDPRRGFSALHVLCAFLREESLKEALSRNPFLSTEKRTIGLENGKYQMDLISVLGMVITNIECNIEFQEEHQLQHQNEFINEQELSLLEEEDGYDYEEEEEQESAEIEEEEEHKNTEIDLNSNSHRLKNVKTLMNFPMNLYYHDPMFLEDLRDKATRMLGLVINHNEMYPALLQTLIIGIREQYLKLSSNNNIISLRHKRFFDMVLAVPLEIQMWICNLVYHKGCHYPKNFVRNIHLKNGLKAL